MKKTILTLTLIGIPCLSYSNNNNDKLSKNDKKSVEIITPNHNSINSELISDEKSEFIMYLKNDANERESIGVVSEHIQRIQLNEQKSFRVKKQSFTNGNEEVLLTMASVKSLKPRYSISKDKHAIRQVNFVENQIQGEVVLDGKSRVFVDQSEVPFFDAQTADLVMRSLPLDSGYSAMFWAYNADKMNSLEYQTVTVVDEIKTKNAQLNTVDAWLVKKSSSNVDSFYTIEKTTRQILKIETKLESGKTLIIERI